SRGVENRQRKGPRDPRAEGPGPLTIPLAAHVRSRRPTRPNMSNASAPRTEARKWYRSVTHTTLPYLEVPEQRRIRAKTIAGPLGGPPRQMRARGGGGLFVCCAAFFTHPLEPAEAGGSGWFCKKKGNRVPPLSRRGSHFFSHGMRPKKT